MKEINIGKYTAYFSEDRIYFEHNKLGEDDAICFYLDQGQIYDYDMSYGIPRQVGEWLHANGYNVVCYDGEWEYEYE